LIALEKAMRPSKTKPTKNSQGPQSPRLESAARLSAPPVAPPAPDGGQVTEDEIRVLAYHKWELAGRPAGDGVDFWRQAEMELRR
jgi:hypothetical protein